MAAGLLADRVFGEARRFHPLVGFGRWAGWVEKCCRRLFFGTKRTGMRLAGLPPGRSRCCLGGARAVAARSIRRRTGWWTARAVLRARRTQPGRARAWWRRRSRPALPRRANAGGLDREPRHPRARRRGRGPAVTESVLENGNDAVFGALLWFVLGGGGWCCSAPGEHRSMMRCGATARRATCTSAGRRRASTICRLAAGAPHRAHLRLAQTHRRRSRAGARRRPPGTVRNAGPVMAAGGGLGVRRAAATYHGRAEHRRHWRGHADVDAIRAAVALVRRGALLRGLTAVLGVATTLVGGGGA